MESFYTAGTSNTKNTTTTNNSASSSPILNLAQDHLFTILLQLPIESILCFSMTCKKFRSLTSCETLWEAICRREWGPTSVDSIKFTSLCSSSDTNMNQQQQIPWMRLYKQVKQLDSVSCLKLSDPDCDFVSPGPRASHSLNFVSDCLVLFGGGCEGGRHLDDTWVAYVGNDFKREMKWHKVSSGVPSGRFGHTCVTAGEYLVLFGGINDHGNRQNDTWLGKVVLNGDLGLTLSWRLLDVGSIAPPPRGAHAACCIEKTKMVIHGGIGLYGLRLGDTWVLELSESYRFGSWHELLTSPSPPARSGHSLTCIKGTGTVLFGGRGLGYEVLNDVWLLQPLEGQLKWVPIFYELQNLPEGFLLPRVGHSATLLLGDRLLIYGGEDSQRHRKDDFWVLDVSAIKTNKSHQIAMSSKRSVAKMWRRLKANGYKPNCRSFHRACTDYAGRRLYVFGGMVDGLLQPAETAGLRFDNELFVVNLLPQMS